MTASRPSPDQTFRGQVHKYHANFYYVVVEEMTYECSLRGVLKKALKSDDAAGTVVVGDCVTVDNLDPANKTARIADILPRANIISRPKIANVDQVLIVHPAKEPDFDTTQVDRYLTRVTLSGLPAIICVSKCDLADDKTIEEIKNLYQQRLGHAVVCTSTIKQQGLSDLLSQCESKVSVMAGPSGGGKSSLLNALNPDLRLKTGDISAKIERGQHTTRHVELIPMAAHTLIADTPGFSQLKFDDVMPVDIEGAFAEFEPFRGQCAFNDCLHIFEPGSADEEGCGIQNNPEIAASRYASYREFVAEALVYKTQARDSSDKSEYGYKTLNRKGDKQVNILRLKEKNREASRRTQRQEVSSLMDTERADGEEADNDE